MTAMTANTAQKRLDSCVLTLPKWPPTEEKLGANACEPLKTDDLVPDAIVRTENAHQIGQTRRNANLLGTHRIRCGVELSQTAFAGKVCQGARTVNRATGVESVPECSTQAHLVCRQCAKT